MMEPVGYYRMKSSRLDHGCSLHSHPLTTMNLRTLLLPFVILPSLFSILFAAPPPELTVLREQYEKAVTAPHDAAVSELNTKFNTALGNAVTAAKQAGKLEEVLAIQEDQKRLADKLPLPDDDEKTPEGLKKLRTIYRDQLAKLEAQRTANHTALLPAYTAKLKDLEAHLTKVDRIEEAKEVMTYREGLAAGAPTPQAVATANAPAAPSSPTAPAAAQPPKVRGDDRKAAEWLLGIGGEIQLSGGGTTDRIKDLAKLPKGRFEITNIWFPGGMAPIDVGEFDHLRGLQGLRVIKISGFNQTDEALSFVSTCPNLAIVDVQNWKTATGAWLRHLAPLRNLVSIYCITAAKSDASGISSLDGSSLNFVSLRDSATNDETLTHIAKLKKLQYVGLRKTNVTDAGVARLGHLSELKGLDVTETTVSIEGLKPLAHLKLDNLGFGKSAADVEGAAPELSLMFPKLESYSFAPGSVPTSALAAVAKAWHKLNDLKFATFTRFDDDAFQSVGPSLPELEQLFVFQTKITDNHLAQLAQCKKLRELNLELCPEITDASIPHLQAIKSLKVVYLKQTKITPDAITSLKKQRPDLSVK